MDAISLSSLVSAISSAASAMVAIFAIRYSNQNSRQAILTGKLEELYQVIDQISQHYDTFITLYFAVADYKRQTRDEYLRPEDRKQIESLISRLEVLAKCYTKGNLQDIIVEYHQMSSVLYYYVAHLNSLAAQSLYPDGFPTHARHYELVQELKTEILKKIKIK